MKKFLDLSSWSRWSLSLSKGAVIGFMLIMAFAFVGCDDSSSASAGQNDEPGVESSSSSSGKVTEPDEVTSSSSEKAKSSSSVTQSDVKQSSSSEKTGKSSSSVDPRHGGSGFLRTVTPRALADAGRRTGRGRGAARVETLGAGPRPKKLGVLLTNRSGPSFS